MFFDPNGNPYTAAVINQLGINPADLRQLASDAGPTGECARAVVNTITNIRHAEYDATQAVASLTGQAKAQAANLAGGGRYDSMWLTNAAEKARVADAKLTSEVEHLTMLTHLLRTLTGQATD